MKKILKCLFSALLLFTNLYFVNINAQEEVTKIELSSTVNSDGTYSNTATINGTAINEYDYCWHIDPNTTNKDVKNVPGVYYTGTKPDDSETIYVAHDVYYYPELDTSKFVKKTYGDETEWVYYYENEELSEYIFSTLPVEGTTVPTEYMHSAQEAYQNAVLHINKAGTYELTGTWHGQISIDLGEDAFDDETCVVTLILNNVTINCTVASGICFYNVYEVDNDWEDQETYNANVDLTGTGANIIIADDSTNNVSGANIYRLLKTKFKDEEAQASEQVAIEQKKYLKIDGALYSYQSLTVQGQEKANGVLNINSTFEGLDTELHLAINSATLNIYADNDGINCNEDDVSVIQFNGGNVNILAGLGSEGDGIDSNGYIVVNGGTIVSIAKEMSDNGLDSSSGTYIYGGTVVALGSSMQEVFNDNNITGKQASMYLVFASQLNYGSTITVKDSSNNVLFAFDGANNEMLKQAKRSYSGMLISCADFKFNETYSVYLNATLTGTQENGIYLKGNVKAKNGSQLQYSSTGNNNFPGNIPGGNQGGMPGDQGNTRGENQGNMPSDFNPGNQSEIPNGSGATSSNNQENQNGQPSIPNGDETNGKGFNGNDNKNFQTEGSTEFTITLPITTFSNVTTTSTNSTSQPTTVSLLVTILTSVCALGIGVVIGVLITSKKKQQA